MRSFGDSIRTFLNLTSNVLQALNLPRSRFVRSIFGEPNTRAASYDFDFETEFALLYPPSPEQLGTVRKVVLPPLPWIGRWFRGPSAELTPDVQPALGLPPWVARHRLRMSSRRASCREAGCGAA
jgi:hypothetical protein